MQNDIKRQIDEYYEYLENLDMNHLIEEFEEQYGNIGNIGDRNELIKLLIEKEERDVMSQREDLMRKINRQLSRDVNYSTDTIITLDELLEDIAPTKKCKGESLFMARWIMYLLYNTKNHNLCIPNTAIVNKNKKLYNGTRASIIIFYNDVAKSIYPKNIDEIITTCQKRYLVFFLAIVNISGNIGHSNLIIIDKYLKTLERFEPNGQVSFYNQDFIDSFIYNKIISQIPDYSYIKPLDFCPIIGPQRKQQNNIFCPFDNYGFCITWILYYLHLRLINPSIPPSMIIDHILSYSPPELLSIIRRYQNLIDFIIPDPDSSDIVDFDNSLPFDSLHF